MATGRGGPNRPKSANPAVLRQNLRNDRDSPRVDGAPKNTNNLTEDSTEDAAWSAFDEAQSLNTQDVSPEDLDRAVELLNHYGRIALCGPPKSGKSSLAHALLKHYKGQGCTAYVVHKLLNHHQVTKGQKGRCVVLMDGSLGDLRANGDQLKACMDLMDQCLLILTIYPHVLRDVAVLENPACPLLPPSVVIKMEPHHPLSAVDYLPLFERMKRESEQTLLALLALCMQGSYHFDQNPQEVARSLQRLEFSNVGPYDLKPLANILKGTILHETDPGFPSRLEYDAAGLALGRFCQSLLLKVCDNTFILQRVRTSGRPDENIVMIDSSKNAYQELVKKIYDMFVGGQMSVLCQHPSFECPTFFRNFQAVCAREQLVNAVDRKYSLPLLYWSVWNRSTQLTNWCLTIMTEHITSREDLSESLLSSTLAIVMFVTKTDLDLRSRARRFVADFTLMKFSSPSVGELTLTLPFPSERPKIAADMSENLCYLGNPSLAIPASLLSINVTEDAVSVELSSQHWNLALRLVADRQPDETDNNGDTLLHLAAHAGHLQTIKVAIKSGASVTITNKKGQSPYQLAQRRRMAQKDYTVCHTDITSLHSDCVAGDTEAIKVAVCHKASVHDRVDNQDSLLYAACGADQVAVASLLIQLGADTDCRGQYKDTPLHLACTSGHIDIARLLLQHGAQVNATDCREWTPLYGASWNNRTDVAFLLLQHGAEVNTKGSRKETPLHGACWNGNFELAARLVQREAEVNARNGNCETPLHGACSRGHAEVAKLLMQHKAQVNARSDRQRTPLNEACPGGHFNVAELLIQGGAQVNAKDGEGWTPLHLACGDGYLELASLLIQRRAQVDAKGGQGWAPLHRACTKGHTEIASLLIEHRAAVNMKGDSGWTPLHEASAFGHAEMVSLLVRHGASVNVQDGSGETPLYEACLNGHAAVASQLIQYGACVNKTDVGGESPLYQACCNGHTEVVSLLVQHGSHVHAKNKHGRTAADIARMRGHESLLNILHTPVQ